MTKIGDDALSLLVRAFERGASDLLIVAGAPPTIYVNARMEALDDHPLDADVSHRLVSQLVDKSLMPTLEQKRDLDFSTGHDNFGRIRINVHYQRGTLAAAIRFVADSIPRLEDLNLPATVCDFARFPRGMVLITGPTGSGKSTTMAAMINEINGFWPAHVITLEDPIEYSFKNDRCVIEQREIGVDSPGFADALRHVVRQKPDVIMVGELRDLETIRTALTAAETGHLLLASLHTINAAQTVERIIDVFDSGQQAQIRIQLAGSLRAIVSQTLFARRDGSGVVPAVEILINTTAVSRAIREGESHLIPGMIETGANSGMQTLDRQIAHLVRSGTITEEIAMAKAVDPAALARMLAQTETRRTQTVAGRS